MSELKKMTSNEFIEYTNNKNEFNNLIIYKIKIAYSEKKGVKVKVFIKNIKSEIFILSCENVIEYSFCYDIKYFFYNIETYKFIIQNDSVYISFDPADENPTRNYDDGDYVIAKKVTVYMR